MLSHYSTIGPTYGIQVCVGGGIQRSYEVGIFGSSLQESYERKVLMDPILYAGMSWEKRTGGSSVSESHGRRGMADLLCRKVLEWKKRTSGSSV